MPPKYKTLIIVLAGCILLGLLMGLRLWYKPHKNIKDADAKTVTAFALYKKFTSDSAAAELLYKEKVLIISGSVKQVFLNKENHQVILLKTDTNDGYVNCTMEENIPNPHVGGAINIKGLCSGYNGDPDLGISGDVIMIRCYSAK